ncbi:hypothetical protein LPW26_14935 [Rhodopseudomonas sp. HC1]|uniref:hypothetical protein n=1 Tax=Rhodopseudomonas infernalis TaxID=2897386 RepID=UPI001EE7D445|nr:hypothetical protein [Rhodopseudomonas infernalis]MCG6205945.1 hypothetical protein [Rhodopseudomonas infernalis]
MNELQAWVAQQHHGLRTFKSFQLELEQFAVRQPAQRGLCSVLANLVESYIVAFDEEPVPVDLANDVHHRLTQLLSTLDLDGDPERRLEDINRVANFTLWPTPQTRA